MKKFVALCLVVLLAGCTTRIARLQGPANMQAFEARRAAILEIQRFEIQGRVGIRTLDDGWSGGLGWVQDHDQLDFSFRGPLGAGSIQVSGDADALRVQTSKGHDFVTNEAELDFTQELGAAIPVRALRYWMLGIPQPGGMVEQLDIGRGGLLWSMRQDGWQVEIASYAEVGKAPDHAAGLRLPDRLQILQGDLIIKLVIREWKIGTGSTPSH